MDTPLKLRCYVCGKPPGETFYLSSPSNTEVDRAFIVCEADKQMVDEENNMLLVFRNRPVQYVEVVAGGGLGSGGGLGFAGNDGPDPATGSGGGGAR